MYESRLQLKALTASGSRCGSLGCRVSGWNYRRSFLSSHFLRLPLCRDPALASALALAQVSQPSSRLSLTSRKARCSWLLVQSPSPKDGRGSHATVPAAPFAVPTRNVAAWPDVAAKSGTPQIQNAKYQDGNTPGGQLKCPVNERSL
jgi:hypothetical protein